MSDYQCGDCQKVFNPGQSEDSISPTAQCPDCYSYHTQPYRAQPSPTQSDMAPRNMPDSATDDDTGGNPLQEGILGDYQNRQVRDESFSSSYKISLFETPEFDPPEFETSELVLPPDLYQYGREVEQQHRAQVQVPHGITDNLHAALGNLQSWVENPHENGALRPYNDYWKTIRPAFMKPGSLQIGVADPTMAEIINHVADTDDLTPLYEYRGRESHVKTAGPLVGLLPEGAAALLGGGAADAAAGTAADLAAGGEAAATAGASEAGASASGVGGLMNGVMNGAGREVGKNLMGQGLGYVDDLFGGGMSGGGQGGGGGGMPVQDVSYYSATSDDALFPDSHDEIPKNDDGDSQQKDDGNSHEWQRDLSVDDQGGGSLGAPSFDPAGPAFERFKMLLPLLKQMIEAGEDGSQDPLIQGLHQSLEAEIPGYLDHADDAAGQELLILLSPEKASIAESEDHAPDKHEPGVTNEPGPTDENSGGAHEANSKVASISGEAAEFLPDFTVTLPNLRQAVYPGQEAEGYLPGAIYPGEEALDSGSWPKNNKPETCPFCGANSVPSLGMCIHCGKEIYPDGAGQAQAMEYQAKTASQGPETPEQIAAVQQYIFDHARQMGLEGDELNQTILSVPTDPIRFADVLAVITGRDAPPEPPADAGFSAEPPPQAQENAPPGATMPVPGMSQQMMSAVAKYAADSVAGKCPHCGGHTTGMLDEDGSSYCHSCHKTFKTEGKTPHSLTNTASTWNVEEDLRKEALVDSGSPDIGLNNEDPAPQGIPAADQHQQEDHRREMDSGHTWIDKEGNPLKVGQEYEMYSDRYDIPDLVRIEAVKPSSVVYTLTGEYGLESSSELTKEEADLEGLSFKSTDPEGELGMDDSLEDNNDDNTAYTGSPEHTDLSAPHGMVAASVNPDLAWLAQGGLAPVTAGASYTPMEQRALIDEMGSARNSDLLSLEGTHYLQDAEEDNFLFGI